MWISNANRNKSENNTKKQQQQFQHQQQQHQQTTLATPTTTTATTITSLFFLPLCAPRRLCLLHFDRVRHKVFPLSPLPRRDQSKRSWRRQTIHRFAEMFILRAFVTLNQGFSNFICWHTKVPQFGNLLVKLT
jgi:hypothetical protein